MASGRSARLVGRDAELGRLRDLAAEAASGTARVALVRGEPGIGKTRLVSELLDELRADGALVLTGQGLELADGAMAYGVASALVRGAVRQAGVDRVRELAGAHADALGVLHPALGAAGGASRQALFGALDVLVAGLAADRPVCLAVDDFQWVDASSRELLRFLASSLADLPVLLVATVRTTPADLADASQDVAALARTPGSLVLGLSALPPEAVATQLAEVVGPDPDPALVERVQRLSEGVPLYVEELAAGDGHRLSLSARLSGLSLPTTALLRAAAVAEGRADLALVARVAGLRPDRADAAFRDAVDRGLLESSREGVVRFHHGLLREQVLDGIEPLALRGLHAAWADVVPEMAGGLLSHSETVTARALHLAAADDVRAALPASIEAAVVARRDGAWSESVGWWQRSLDLWDACPDAHAVSGVVRAELIGDLVVARQYVPRPEGFAPDRARIQAALARSSPEDWIDRVLLHGVLDMMERYAGHAVSWQLDEPLDAVLARVADLLPARVAMRTLTVLLAAHGDATTSGYWERVLDAARQTATDGDAYQLAAALNNYGYVLLRSGDEEGVLAVVDEYARRPELAPYLPARLPSLCYFLVALGRPEEAMKVVESQLDVDNLGPGGLSLWRYALPNYATSAYLAGEWDRCTQVCALIAGTGVDPLTVAMAASLAVMVQVRRGEAPAAAAVEAVVRSDVEDITALGVTGLGRTALALRAGAQGDLDDAWVRLGQLLDAPDFPHDPEASIEPLLRSAQLLLALPARDERRVETVRVALGHLQTGGRYAAAVRLEVQTILDVPDDPGRWAEVVAAWDRVGRSWDAAHSRLRWAAALLAAGDRETAADAVREGLAVVERLGAAPLADELRSLARSGRLAVASAPEPTARPHGLTEREAEVLALVGRGLTNAQIGERLYMSPKTASVHVSRLIAKLGVANRTEAAAHAQRLGLVDG